MNPAGYATANGPHLRAASGLGTVARWWGIALAPALVFGLWNTGYQANLALAGLGLEAATWRGAVLDALALGRDPESVPASVVHGLLYFLPVFLAAAVAVAAWETLFARLRGGLVMEGWWLTALIFAMVLPPAAPLWQVALGMSFGVVVGKEIFGGTGKNFMNPALLGLAFLFLTYPGEMVGHPLWTGLSGYGGAAVFDRVAAGGIGVLEREGLTWGQAFLGVVQGAMGKTSALACLIGAVVLVAKGFASWRVMAGVAIGAVVTAVVFDAVGGRMNPAFAIPWYWHLVLGGFAFGAVFLATEPASAASTNGGRWVYGLLIGFMIVTIRAANPAHPDGVMLAVLFGNIFAPLIDHAVIRANLRRRRARGG